MSVKIQVNVFNRLKKIRKGVVYGSIESVIDELIQNCQRSLAKSEKDDKIIDVVIQNDTLIIRDNGVGCEDPSNIFEFETSGWGLEHAFGQGGSESVFQLADWFEISSLDWKVQCDVEEVLSSENLDLEKQENEYLDGYQLAMRGKLIEEQETMITKYVEKLLERLDLTCFVNGEKVRYSDIQEFNCKIYKKKFDNEFYSATLEVSNSWKDIEVYYEKRKVMDDWFSGVYGVIELKDSAVDLKAPDRKDIIRNNKYYNCQEQIRKDIKELYKEALAFMKEEELEEYAEKIVNILSPDDYIKYLSEIEVDKDIDEVINNILGLDKKVEQARTEEATEAEVEVIRDMAEVTEIRQTEEVYKINDEYELPKQEAEEKISYKKEETKFKEKIKQEVNSVWVERSKKDDYKKEIEMVASYGIKIFIANNKLYEEGLKFLKVVHISDFIQKSEEEFIVREGTEAVEGDTVIKNKDKIREKEERILKVLGIIEKNYGLENVFSIAKVEKKLRLGEINTMASKIDVAVMKEDNKIILDRDMMNLDIFDLDTAYDEITKYDILVVMSNVDSVAGGLAQLMFGTINNTVEHYNKVKTITKEIAIMLNNSF